jgi:uncharacterized BrkB/YihY/UPF0761 family membrane protein
MITIMGSIGSKCFSSSTLIKALRRALNNSYSEALYLNGLYITLFFFFLILSTLLPVSSRLSGRAIAE